MSKVVLNNHTKMLMLDEYSHAALAGRTRSI